LNKSRTHWAATCPEWIKARSGLGGQGEGTHQVEARGEGRSLGSQRDGLRGWCTAHVYGHFHREHGGLCLPPYVRIWPTLPACRARWPAPAAPRPPPRSPSAATLVVGSEGCGENVECSSDDSRKSGSKRRGAGSAWLVCDAGSCGAQRPGSRLLRWGGERPVVCAFEDGPWHAAACAVQAVSLLLAAQAPTHLCSGTRRPGWPRHTQTAPGGGWVDSNMWMFPPCSAQRSPCWIASPLSAPGITNLNSTNTNLQGPRRCGNILLYPWLGVPGAGPSLSGGLLRAAVRCVCVCMCYGLFIRHPGWH